VASFQISSLGGGDNEITASYDGDDIYLGSLSDPLDQQVVD
jgi:hypothetical protein